MTWFRRLSTCVPPAKGSPRDAPNTSTIPALRYPELSRLPKAHKIRSIRFKRTNPGTVSHLSYGPDTTPVLDSSHPLAHSRLQQLMRVVPQYHCSLFGVHAYPHSVLRKFEDTELMIQLKDKAASSEFAALVARNTPKQSPGAEQLLQSVTVGDRRRAAHTIPMSLMIVTPKRPLHKSGTIRTKIKLRLKEALSLVTIRGASSHESNQRIVLSSPEGLHREDSQTNIIVQGWTYVIRPSLEAYSCPWPLLLEHVKEGLMKIQSHATALEAKWAAKGSHRAEFPRPPSQQKARSHKRLSAKSNIKQTSKNQISAAPP